MMATVMNLVLIFVIY